MPGPLLLFGVSGEVKGVTMEWRDKAVLITGAASGIGKATAEELCKQGARVLLCDLNEEAGEELARQLTARYGREQAIFCECDVTDYSQFEEAFNTVLEVFGKVDVVINNAGVLNDRLWELEVDVNMNGVIRGTLLALQIMGKDRGGDGGVVVNIGSNCSLRPYISVPIYSATQHAILGFSRAFGDPFHVASTGVRVICVCPSTTSSNLVQEIRKQLISPNFEKAWKRDTYNAVCQRPEHVASCISHLAATAESGSVWLIENGLAAKQINYH